MEYYKNEKKMVHKNNKDPLHGVTLKAIVCQLHKKYGWDKLGQLIKINCFVNDPSLNSSLKFLRKTPWAREKVEQLYIQTKKPNSDFKWTN